MYNVHAPVALQTRSDEPVENREDRRIAKAHVPDSGSLICSLDVAGCSQTSSVRLFRKPCIVYALKL